MEKTYDPSCYLASEHIKIKEFLSTYKRALDKLHIFDNDTPKQDSNEFSGAFSLIGNKFSDEEKELLIRTCSVGNFDTEDDVKPMDITGQSFARVITNFKPFQGYSKLITICRKKKAPTIDFLNRMTIELQPARSDESKRDLRAGEQVLVTISVMRPIKYQFAQRFHQSKLKLFKEITLLGSNTLADFRDMVDCPADSIVCREVSEKPDFELNYPSSQALYPSGFVFIDGVFYNDFRKEKCKDYSEVLRRWAADKGIGHFTTAEMVDTRLDQLSPRVGYPYVYQHKGCCEHVFLFSQIRVLNSSDVACSTSYPYHSKIARSNDRYCILCGTNFANWLVTECDRLPQSNAPLCTTCFKSYNYIDGTKVGHFKAYPYNHLSDVL